MALTPIRPGIRRSMYRVPGSVTEHPRGGVCLPGRRLLEECRRPRRERRSLRDESGRSGKSTKSHRSARSPGRSCLCSSGVRPSPRNRCSRVMGGKMALVRSPGDAFATASRSCGLRIACSIGAGNGAFDQVHLDRRRGTALERIPQHDSQERWEPIDPENPRRLPQELAEAGAIKLEEWRIAKHQSSRAIVGVKEPVAVWLTIRRASCPGGGQDRFLRFLPPMLNGAAFLGRSSRRWRPVRATKTSSRLTWRVVKPGQRPVQALEFVEQGGDGPVRLGHRQGISVGFGPGRED